MTPLASSIRRVSDNDGSILLDLRRGTMFRLNPLGSQILDRLERGESLPHIAEQISAQFAIALDEVQSDVKEFLSSLELHGVLDPPDAKNAYPNGR
jgi:Coenzyme PQQ synthesis protein D (PqqD)